MYSWRHVELPLLPLGPAFDRPNHGQWFDAAYDPKLTPRLQVLLEDLSKFKPQNEKSVDHVLGKVYEAAFYAIGHPEGVVAYDKQSQSSTGTGKHATRPDTRVVFECVDVIRGESKTKSADLSVAKTELMKKMRPWSAYYYGDLPSILGIAAADTSFDLQEINRDGRAISLANGNFNVLSDSVKVLQAAIRVLAYCKLRYETEGWGNAFQRRRTVSLQQVGDCEPVVIKSYEQNRPLLAELYQVCADIAGLERGKVVNKDNRFELSPVGCTRTPSAGEAAAALKQIAETVAGLHAKGWAHRDLRWGNIVLETTRDYRRWTIIDCEFAAKLGSDWASSSPPRNGFKVVDPQQGGFVSEQRDFYLLGKMIQEISCNHALEVIGEELVQDDPDVRKAAFSCLLRQ
jgi:hypothetical protein